MPADDGDADQVDVGDLATWTVSSAKRGFGVDHLRDGSTSTLWQSEGPQPHTVKIEFPRKVAVSEISLFTDVALDDSYTPSKISISAGTSLYDLQVVKTIDLEQPKGWQHFKLGTGADDDEAGADMPDDCSDDDDERLAIKAHIFQLAILANHLNGKDTHVRCVRIFSPKTARTFSDFTAGAFTMHRTIR